MASFGEIATFELPSPQDDLSKMIESFSSKGFDEREAVSLLGIVFLLLVGILSSVYLHTDEIWCLFR